LESKAAQAGKRTDQKKQPKLLWFRTLLRRKAETTIAKDLIYHVAGPDYQKSFNLRKMNASTAKFFQKRSLFK